MVIRGGKGSSAKIRAATAATRPPAPLTACRLRHCLATALLIICAAAAAAPQVHTQTGIAAGSSSSSSSGADGDSWQPQRSGTMTGLRAAFFLDDNLGWIVGGAGILLKTEDGGRTAWRTMRRPTEDTLWDVRFFDEDAGWLLAERSIYKLKEKEEPRSYLLKTTDGGVSWLRVEIKGVDPDALLVRLIFVDERHWYAVGEAGSIFVTRDAGRRWARQRPPRPHLLLGGAFIDADRGFIVGAGPTLLQTEDGGESWRAVPLNLPGVRLNAVHFVDEKHGWAVGSGGTILASTNGGRTWRPQTPPTDEDLFDVSFFDAREGWAVGASGVVLHTADGGASWAADAPRRTKHPLARVAFGAAAARRRSGVAVGFGGTILSYRTGAAAAAAPE